MTKQLLREVLEYLVDNDQPYTAYCPDLVRRIEAELAADEPADCRCGHPWSNRCGPLTAEKSAAAPQLCDRLDEPKTWPCWCGEWHGDKHPHWQQQHR